MPILHSADSRSGAVSVLAGAPLLAGLPPFASKLLPLKRAQELYERARTRSGTSILENLLREMEVDLRIEAADLQRIPKNGPVIVVSNHPYGMLDGAVLGALLTRVRADVKVMTNFLLAGVPELEQCCIFVQLRRPDRKRVRGPCGFQHGADPACVEARTCEFLYSVGFRLRSLAQHLE